MKTALRPLRPLCASAVSCFRIRLVRRLLAVSIVTLLWAIVAVCPGPARTAAAQTTAAPADASCRGCHGDTQRELTLPSGETRSLRVDLARLDVSAHSSSSASPVTCRGCHMGKERYLYPHAPNPAQTRAEFRAEVVQSCESCHYSHTPFHDVEGMEYTPPTCIDCHGSHAIDRVETITATMPANCLTCHTDKPLAWAADFVAPRPGLGEGAEGYAGSTRCAGCHDDIYFTWRETPHANIVRDAVADPSVILGDFSGADGELPFAADDVAFTHGSLWKQQYLTQTVEGKLSVLPAAWNVAAEAWMPYGSLDAPLTEWLPACSYCHVTGLDTTTWGFTEFNVGCEGCHGPSEAHAADPEHSKPYAKADDQVCGACHSRGESPEGHPFPATYQPGDILSEHFTFASGSEVIWPDGSAKRNHQQYMDWKLGSSMSLASGVGCTTCHAVHDGGAARAQLRRPLNDLCLECHNEHNQRMLVHHTPFHEQAIKERDFLCTDCHMPKLATLATPFDLHTHSFLQPDPQSSIDFGGVEAMPNACNECHSDYGESPQWAAQTIEHASTFAKPSSSVIFGPGPTPTSPPPPTPISSVGQPVVRAEVATGQWLRTAFWVVIGLGVVAVVTVIGRTLWKRRTNHV